MNYNTHIQNLKTNFSNLDLLKELDFEYFFNNEDFAKSCINICVDLCNKASEKLKINLNFGVLLNYKFNASVGVKEKKSYIIFNLGFINRWETIISDSVELFCRENIAKLTISDNEKNKLKSILNECCISYLFYHELAHILQLSDTKTNNTYDFQEQSSTNNLFDIKKHIYEIDADHFGSIMSTVRLLEKLMDSNNQLNPISLFNYLTALLFTTSNMIIEFSQKSFQEIYYKKNSHPHPLIRIMGCKEQILEIVSKNLQIQHPLLLSILERTGTMLSQIQYSNGRIVDYPKLHQEHFKEIETYNDEIEEENKLYKELVRFKSQDFFNNLYK
ncbi:hypothetical protein [Aquimarina celericrescens]|uniref:Peptidase M48 domain-containing protein n=1 Tax=Aquimarina celericrescens TaxID=1964542 RepID=A0ABW5AZZ2_9FLAO|nr:hypothetical protein [Aquimarina celericrescens]